VLEWSGKPAAEVIDPGKGWTGWQHGAGLRPETVSKAAGRNGESKDDEGEKTANEAGELEQNALDERASDFNRRDERVGGGALSRPD
jgi:hypothetical protein